jgi:hypothetical protein
VPAVSKAQARAMYAAASGNSTIGIPQSVGKEFTAGFKGKTGSVKALPARVKDGKPTRKFGSLA